MTDGVALGSAAHPVAPWWRLVWLRFFGRREIRAEAIETAVIELPGGDRVVRYINQGRTVWPGHPDSGWVDTCQGHKAMLDALACADGAEKAVKEALDTQHVHLLSATNLADAMQHLEMLTNWLRLKSCGGQFYSRTVKRTSIDEVVEEERQLI